MGPVYATEYSPFAQGTKGLGAWRFSGGSIGQALPQLATAQRW
jgi:hypothetical protein